MGQWSSDQVRMSGASMEADWGGVTIRGISKLDMSDELQRDPEYGNDQVSIGLPAGTYKAELSLEVISEEADRLRNALGSSAARIPGTIGVSFFEAEGSEPIFYQVTGVYLNGSSLSVEAGGQKSNKETLKAIVTQPIDWNGFQLATQKANGFSGIDLGSLL